MPFIPWEDIERELNQRNVPEPVRVQMKMDWFKDFIENDPTVRQQIGDQGIQQFKQEFFASDPVPLRQELVQGQDDRTILEKALGVLGDIVGKPLTVQKRGLSPEARAQATVELQARQEGIPVEEYREATKFEALPQAFVEEIPGVMALQRAATGIQPWKHTSKTARTLEKLGHAGGFALVTMAAPELKGLPIIGKILSKLGTRTLERATTKLIESGITKEGLLTEIASKLLTRRIPEEATHLGMASTIASLNQILESKDATEAAKKMAHAAKSGAITGAIFGTLSKMFPYSKFAPFTKANGTSFESKKALESILKREGLTDIYRPKHVGDGWVGVSIIPGQRPGRVLTGLLALEAQHILEDPKHRMFWKRGDPLDLITDTAMSLFFLWNGGGEAALAEADQVLNSVNGKPVERVFSDYAKGKISTKDLLNLDKRHRQLEFSGPYQKYKDIVEMVESEPSIEGKLRIIDTMLERSDQVKAYGLEPALEELRSSIEEGVPRDKAKEPPQYVKKPELKSSKKVAKELEDAVVETTKDVTKPPEEAGKTALPQREQAQQAVGAEEVSPEVAGVRRIVEEVTKEEPLPTKTETEGGEPSATRLREDEGSVLPGETTSMEEAEQVKPSATEGTTTTAEERPAEGSKNLEQPTPEQPSREGEITPQLDKLRSNLNPLQVKVIDKRVQELGNVEAVKDQYRGDTDSGRYAIALAEQLYGKEPQPQPSQPQEIRTKAGKPFKTKGALVLQLKRRGLVDTHEPVQIEGGWVARPKKEYVEQQKQVEKETKTTSNWSDKSLTPEQTQALDRIREAWKDGKLPQRPVFYKLTPKDNRVFVERQDGKLIDIYPDGQSRKVYTTEETKNLFDKHAKTLETIQHVEDIKKETAQAEQREKKIQKAKKQVEGVYRDKVSQGRYKYQDGKWYYWDGEKFVRRGQRGKKWLPTASELDEMRLNGRLEKIPAQKLEQPPHPAEYPFGKISADEEDKFYGSRVRVYGATGATKPYEGTVNRVLNGGRLIEVKPDGSDSIFRIEGRNVEVLSKKEKAGGEEKLPAPTTSRPKAKMTRDQIEAINGAIDLHKYYLNRGGETLLHLEEAAKEGIIPKELVKPILDRIVQLERQGKLGETGAEWRYSVKKVREYFDDILAEKGFEAATTSKKTKPKETEPPEPTIEKVDIPLVREKSPTYPDVYTTYDEVFKAKPDVVIVRRRIVHDPSKPDLKKYYEYLTYEKEGDKWVLQKGVGRTRTDALRNFEHFDGKELDIKAIEKKILEREQPEQQLPTAQKAEEKQRLQQLQQQIEPYTPEAKVKKPGISQIGLGKRDFQWFLGKTKDGKKIYISKAVLDVSEPRYLQAKQIKEPEGSTTPIVDTEVFKDWTEPVEPIAVHRNFEGIEKKGDVLYFDVDGKLIAIYKPYIDYFRHKYGEIELRTNPQKDPASNPLAIYHNGKFVGVVMPLYSKGGGIFPTIEEVKSIIKEQPSTIDTLKSKAISTIKSNKGTSAIINDVAKLGAELIRRGYTKLSDFKRQLRQQLSDVWEQVKPLIGRIYLAARQATLSQRGAIGEVTEDEVKPYLKPKDKLNTTTLAKTAKKASSAIEVIPRKVQEVFAPAEVSERAGEIAYRLRRARGKTYEVVTRLEQQLKTAQDIIDRLPKEVIDKAQYLYETGNADKIKDPTLHRFFAEILPELDKVSLHFINQTQKLLDRKAIEGLSNYLAHLYKDPQKATSVLSDILSGKTRTEARGQQFLKHRVIPTYAEAEALGLERRFKNPIDTTLYHMEAVMRWAETMRTFKELKDDGLIKFFRVGKKGTEAKLQHPDWVRLKDPAFTALFPTEKGVVVAGSYYAPPDVARILNNASSRGMADFKTFQALRSATNFVNMLNMSMSIFHGSFSAVTNGMNYLAMALADLPRLRLKSAARNLARAALSAPIPIQTIRDVIEGKRMIDASEYTPIVKFYMRSGGKIGLDPLYDITYTRPERLLKQAMAEGRLKGLRNPALLLSAVLDKLNTPIMRIMVPALKVRAFEELFMHEMSRKNIDMPLDEFIKTKEGEKLAQHVVDLVEDRFGQMNYDNLHWNRFLKHGLQLALRTVGWNYGDIREVMGAGTSIASAMKELAKGNFEGAKGKITQRVFFTMAVPLMHMYISGLLTYLLTGERPKGKDWVAPRSKTGERYSIPSYFRDWMAVKYQGIPTTIKHKLNPIWNIIADQITNTDYWGTKLTRRDDPVLQQLWDRIKHVGDQLLPFSVQSLERTRSGKGKVLSMAGLTKAPTYITRTPTQRLIFELYEEEHHGQIKTKSEAEAQRFKAKIRQKYQETGKIPYDMVNEAEKKGYLPSRLSRTMFIRSLPTEGWQRAFRGLSAESQLEVLKQATEEERLKLWKYAKRMAKIMYNKWKTRRNNKYGLSKISSTVRR